MLSSRAMARIGSRSVAVPLRMLAMTTPPIAANIEIAVRPIAIVMIGRGARSARSRTASSSSISGSVSVSFAMIAPLCHGCSEKPVNARLTT